MLNTSETSETSGTGNTSKTSRVTQSTWLVGAHVEGEDRTEDFLSGKYWKLAEGLDKSAEQMRVNDRIAIKSSYTRKNGLPFDNRALDVSCMAIKAHGTITRVHSDRVEVDWAPS